MGRVAWILIKQHGDSSDSLSRQKLGLTGGFEAMKPLTEKTLGGLSVENDDGPLTAKRTK